MATSKRTTRTPKIGSPLTIRLRAMGCTYCPTCCAFMWPEHTQHVASLAVDQHASRYAVVGGYGNVRLVDLTEDAGEMPAAA